MPYMLRQRITTVGSLEAIPTWRYKLPSVGAFTALELVIDCPRHQDRISATTVFPLETQISKVELVEGGSRALISLPGSQLDALNYWTFKHPNPRRHRNCLDGGNILHLFLMGGRDLFDQRYGYDFGRLAETYLEYSHSMSANAAEKFDTSAHTVTLYGWRWMGTGIPVFQGYLRARQIAAWATTSSGTIKTIEIPTGTPLRRIGVQAKSRAATLGGTIGTYEVRVNNGEYSPVTIVSPLVWTMQAVNEYGLDNEIGGMDYAPAGTAVDLPYWFSYYESLLAQEYLHTGGRVAPYGFITAPAMVEEKLGTATEFVFQMRGWGFQKCLRIGFDHDYDGADLLQTAGMGSLDLVLTEAATTKDAAVFIEDIVTY